MTPPIGSVNQTLPVNLNSNSNNNNDGKNNDVSNTQPLPKPHGLFDSKELERRADNLKKTGRLNDLLRTDTKELSQLLGTPEDRAEKARIEALYADISIDNDKLPNDVSYQNGKYYLESDWNDKDQPQEITERKVKQLILEERQLNASDEEISNEMTGLIAQFSAPSTKPKNTVSPNSTTPVTTTTVVTNSSTESKDTSEAPPPSPTTVTNENTNTSNNQPVSSTSPTSTTTETTITNNVTNSSGSNSSSAPLPSSNITISNNNNDTDFFDNEDESDDDSDDFDVDETIESLYKALHPKDGIVNHFNVKVHQHNLTLHSISESDIQRRLEEHKRKLDEKLAKTVSQDNNEHNNEQVHSEFVETDIPERREIANSLEKLFEQRLGKFSPRQTVVSKPLKKEQIDQLQAILTFTKSSDSKPTQIENKNNENKVEQVSGPTNVLDLSNFAKANMHEIVNTLEALKIISPKVSEENTNSEAPIEPVLTDPVKEEEPPKTAPTIANKDFVDGLDQSQLDGLLSDSLSAVTSLGLDEQMRTATVAFGIGTKLQQLAIANRIVADWFLKNFDVSSFSGIADDEPSLTQPWDEMDIQDRYNPVFGKRYLLAASKLIDQGLFGWFLAAKLAQNEEYTDSNSYADLALLAEMTLDLVKDPNSRLAFTNGQEDDSYFVGANYEDDDDSKLGELNPAPTPKNPNLTIPPNIPDILNVQNISSSFTSYHYNEYSIVDNSIIPQIPVSVPQPGTVTDLSGAIAILTDTEPLKETDIKRALQYLAHNFYQPNNEIYQDVLLNLNFHPNEKVRSEAAKYFPSIYALDPGNVRNLCELFLENADVKDNLSGIVACVLYQDGEVIKADKDNRTVLEQVMTRSGFEPLRTELNGSWEKLGDTDRKLTARELTGVPVGKGFEYCGVRPSGNNPLEVSGLINKHNNDVKSLGHKTTVISFFDEVTADYATLVLHNDTRHWITEPSSSENYHDQQPGLMEELLQNTACYAGSCRSSQIRPDSKDGGVTPLKFLRYLEKLNIDERNKLSASEIVDEFIRQEDPVLSDQFILKTRLRLLEHASQLPH